MTTYQAYNMRAGLYVPWFGTYESKEQLEAKLKEWQESGTCPAYVVAKEV